MELTVIGTGYVGLVAGTCFAETGHNVVCVDKDEAKLSALRKGRIPIYEPRLEALVQRNQEQQRLSFSADLAAAVARAEVVFIAVGTPPGEDGSADLSHVVAVAEAIGRAMVKPLIVATKSTVPVGTGELVRKTIADVSKIPVEIVSNPEFLKEGAAVDDFLKPDRIIVGTDSENAKEVMADLYAPFNRTSERLITMDLRSAEMTKYAANAMLATRISFMNEIANLCEAVGADVERVRHGIGSDPRIGGSFLFPGAGFGGSCFPKDIRALRQTAREAGSDLQILAAVEDVNAAQKTKLEAKIVDVFGPTLEGRVFALWGLAFKPQTDDMREAPSIPLIEALLRRGAKVRATDPAAITNAASLFEDRIALVEHPYDCLDGADALVIITEWNEYRRPSFDQIRTRLRSPHIFDGRNLFNPNRMAKEGLHYHCIGRTTVDV